MIRHVGPKPRRKTRFLTGVFDDSKGVTFVVEKSSTRIIANQYRLVLSHRQWPRRRKRRVVGGRLFLAVLVTTGVEPSHGACQFVVVDFGIINGHLVGGLTSIAAATARRCKLDHNILSLEIARFGERYTCLAVFVFRGDKGKGVARCQHFLKAAIWS